jgi:predicted nuclease of predicted toxin-antitoxin system
MKIWLDAQLSPDIAAWITFEFGYECIAVRDLGLRDASDIEIFEAAKRADIVLITKDGELFGSAVGTHQMKQYVRYSDGRFGKRWIFSRAVKPWLKL